VTSHAPASFGTVCVLGGSIAGLLAARVLADYAEQVVILERDRLADESSVRPSVPQGRHGHYLQPEGLALIERWFPGFTDEARAGGAVFSPAGHQSLFTDGEAVEFPDMTVLTASRPFLESQIRRRVTATANVRVIRGRATGLRYTGGAVSGAAYEEYRAGRWAAGRMLDADFTVDAMGRGSRISHWLADDARGAPGAERVPVGVSYATAVFSRPPAPREPVIATALHQFTAPPPADHRPHAADGRGLAAIAVYAVERNRWQVVAMTYSGNQVPTTVSDLRSLCAGLPPVFREAASGEPIGEAATFYFRDSRRRQITNPESYPAGLASVGDSVATFNPVHGQGMSSAAAQAAILAELFSTSGNPAAQTAGLVRQQQKAIDETWKANAA
jgi:2-polyprenyl-6-methoxyphenol hydroxylase-like FAD-dependent oxidoreductase